MVIARGILIGAAMAALHAQTILVPAAEPDCVRLAAEDLARDAEKVTGKRPPVVVTEAQCPAPCVLIATAGHSAAAIDRFSTGLSQRLAGKWEAYEVRSVPRGLLIAGSDERGAMFGLYAYAEKHLGVDPMYLWTGRAPKRQTALPVSGVALSAGEPTFRFRGWFLNDEDLLTEWKLGTGKRHLAYPFYQHVIPAETARMVYESMLRLGYNFVIPASFVDITNPGEAMLIQEAARRGLYVSMHHVEPVGVSAFAFQNYWRLRQRNVPYSFVGHPDEFAEVWRYFAWHWAKYPNVIWQLGLRGIADQPVWAADPKVPASDEGRGKLISAAMEMQWRIIRAIDRRPDPPATTTLWMEGATLNRHGHLKFPPGVAVIFADDGPGWLWREDFSETPRETGRPYGIYEHHAYWSRGPHMVQAVSPWKAHDMVRQAVERKDTHYALLNVSSVREFPLGVAASAAMLRDYAAFNPDRFFHEWCSSRFGAAAAAAEKAYRQLFDGYIVPADTRTPAMLDGQMCAAAKRYAGRLLSSRNGAASGTGEDLYQVQRSIRYAGQQERSWKKALADGEAAAALMDAEARRFFTVNFLAQQRIALGLASAVVSLGEAVLAADPGPRIQQARSAMEMIRSGQRLASQGEWKTWYRGDRKMNLDELSAMIDQLAAMETR